MDSRRFDSITRRFGAKTSRKQVLQAMAGGGVAAVAGLLGSGRAEAARTHICCGYVCNQGTASQAFTSRCSVQNICPRIEGCTVVSTDPVRRCKDCTFSGF